MQISIKTNFPAVQRSLAALQQDIRAKVLASAVNKTLAQARTQMVREITSTYNVKAGYVRDRLRIKRASFKQGEFSMQGVLIGGDGKRRSANVIAFGATQVAKGVSIKVRKVGGRQVITGAFIGNKGRTVFKRTGKSRLPIGPVRTIDVPQMFNQKKINAAVIGMVRAKFPAIFEADAKFYVARFNNGR